MSRYNEEYYNVGWNEYIIDNVHLYTGLIYKINADFDTLWTRAYTDFEKPNDSDYAFYHMSLLANDEMIIAGDSRISSSSYKALLMLVDSGGNEQWRQYYESGPLNKGINVIPTPDGGFALSCFKWVPQENTSHNYLIKTDSLGNEQWRRYIGGLYADGPLYLANSPDSTIVGAYAYSDYSPPPPSSNSYNKIAVVKYNLQGDNMFEKIYCETVLNREVSSITPDSVGNFVIAGSNKFYPPDANYIYEGSLLKVDNNGDSVWYRQYRHPTTTVSFNHLYGVTAAQDGGFAAVGGIYGFYPDPLGQDIWVIKVDSMGCINFGDCWVGEKEQPLPQSQTTTLSVYPNPARDRIQLGFGPGEQLLPKTLNLFDSFGRLQRSIHLAPGQSDADISNLSPGVYVGVVSDESGWLGTSKFVVY
ncbi:MAG: T9SS type A sorting domain-containing protein [Bacteroidales bacterium]|nr:T9SS type A sorting domain-containing protein [Bacteroidales bacterium]